MGHKKGEIMDDLKRLIAFLFQRGGKEKMSEKEVYMILSFELGWLTPGDGKKVIEKAEEKGYIEREGDEIMPTFDYREVEIPLGFRFDESKVEEMEQDLVSRVVGKALKEIGIGEKKIRERINKLSKELDIYPEIAALVFAKQNGLLTEDLLEEAKEFIKNI